MWAKVDDALLDHSKVFEAGKRIGKNGPATALGFYIVGLLWSSKHLTDGRIPITIIESFSHVNDPLSVAKALVHAGLWEANGDDAFFIHHFSEYNLKARQVKQKRRRDRLRKQAARGAKV